MGKSVKFILGFAMLFLCLNLNAQDDRRKAYEDFINQRTAEFENWRDKANAEFTSYLEKAWEEFMVQTGRKDPIGEVPEQPEYYGKTASESSNAHGMPSDVEMGFPEAMLDMPIYASMNSSESNVDLDFFGFPEMVPFSSSMKLDEVIAKEKSVAQAWEQLSNSEYMPTVEAINGMKDRYGLNDWAVYTLVKKISEAVYDESDVNQMVVTQMFLLSQMKYKVRTGSVGDELVMLIPFAEQIYQVQYITDKELDMYIFGYSPLGTNTPLYTFTQDFSMGEKLISLAFTQQMHVGGDMQYKKVNLPLWSEILGEDFSVPINKPYVEFTYDYPQSDLLTYHHSVVDTQTSKAVLRGVRLKIIKDGMTDEEAVAYILNLVQNGFEYKTDYEMFGRAKPLFIEESLYYGANNCKDRVLIFSWLVKKTLGLETVMLGYPNHVACGVAFDKPVDGDTFSFEGVEYTMCDPTFINAPIGATMPKYRNTPPTIVSTK